MTQNNHLLTIVILILFIGTATTVYAYSEASLTREQTGFTISPATNNNPLISINGSSPYYGGTTNQQFLNITNNYDEPVTVTIYLSQNNWEFSSTGNRTRKLTLQPDTTKTTYVDIGGANMSCSQRTNTYSYTYHTSGDTLTIQNTTNTVTICGGSGGISNVI